MALKCNIKCDACLRLAMISLVITGIILAVPSAMRIHYKNRTYFIIFLALLVLCSLLGLVGLSCKILRAVIILFCILLALCLVMDATVLAIDLCSIDELEKDLLNMAGFLGKPGAIVSENERGETRCCLFGNTQNEMEGKWSKSVIEECCSKSSNFNTVSSKICKLKKFGDFEFRCGESFLNRDSIPKEKCYLVKTSGSLKLIVDILLLILAILFLIRTKKMAGR